MWEPVLWLVLIVAAVRWLTRPHRGPAPDPLPEVGDAPADAEPMLEPRLDDNGLATYTMVVPRDDEAEAAER
jgi:hypothetical protein